jgi:hypothetical protein
LRARQWFHAVGVRPERCRQPTVELSPLVKPTARPGLRQAMSLILIIIVLVLLFGGGGGYYAHRSYGLPGLGGVVGLILVVFLILWLVGGRI